MADSPTGSGLVCKKRSHVTNSGVVVLAVCVLVIVGALICYGSVTIAAIMLVGMAFSLGLYMVRAGVDAIILLLVLLAEQYAVDYDIGPFSARVYAVVGAVAYIAARTAISHRPIFTSSSARVFAAVYAILCIWITLSGVYNGQPPGEVVISVLAGPGLAVLLFIGVQRMASDRRSLLFITVGLAGVATLSAVFAIFQWLDFSFAWSAARAIRSGEGSHDVMFGLVGGHGVLALEEAAAWVPGLTLFSVTLNTQLMAFGIIAGFYGLLSRKRGIWTRAGAVGLAAICLLAIFLSQQRSGIVGIPLALGVYWLLTRRSTGIRRSSRTPVVLGLLAISAASIFVLGRLDGGLEVRPGEGGYRLNRLDFTTLAPRLRIAQLALDVTTHNPIFGGPTEYNDRAVRELQFYSSPHNYFLTASAIYGVPGLILASILLTVAARLARDTLKASRRTAVVDWIPASIAFGFIAYVINSMVHSPSLLLGDPVVIWLIGSCSGYLGMISEERGGRTPTESPERSVRELAQSLG